MSLVYGKSMMAKYSPEKATDEARRSRIPAIPTDADRQAVELPDCCDQVRKRTANYRFFLPERPQNRHALRITSSR